MRIAIITETFPPEVNGVAMTLSRIARGLVAAGHEVLVIRPKQKHEKISDHHHEFREVCVAGLPIPGYDSLNFGLPSGSKIEHVWKAWQPDIAYIATEGPLGFSTIGAAKRLQVPVVSGFHTNFNHYMANYNLPFLKDATGSYLRWFHNRTLATFAPSPDSINQLETMGLQNLRLLGRGVDTALFSPEKRNPELRTEWGASDSDIVALYVGRIAAEKNLPLTIEAMQHLRALRPGTQCVMVGDGPERANVMRRHPEFIYPGMQRGEGLAQHYASADLFIFPSVTETFGNVVTEAMASGLVPIAYDYAAPRQYIEDGSQGFIAAFNDDVDFIRACDRALAAQDTWDEIRNRGRQAMEHLTWSRIVEEFIENLREALSRFPTRDQAPPPVKEAAR